MAQTRGIQLIPGLSLKAPDIFIHSVVTLNISIKKFDALKIVLTKIQLFKLIMILSHCILFKDLSAQVVKTSRTLLVPEPLLNASDTLYTQCRRIDH